MKITAEQVPDAVAEALLIWVTMRETMSPKEFVAVALNAWPGVMMALTTDQGVRCLVDPSDATHIILPLTEKPDA